MNLVNSFILFSPIAETQSYISRVEADGGTIGDKKELDALFRALVDNSILGNVEYLYSRFGGYKDSAGTVTKLYDLGNSDNDVTVFNTAPSLATVGFTAGTYWDSVTGQRSLSNWTFINWGKPDTSTSFMGLAGDSFANESVYLNTSTDTVYYIDSNAGFNAIGSITGGAVGNWNFYSWVGNDTTPQVEGFVNGSSVGTSGGLGGSGDGQFRDERVMGYSGNNFSGDFDNVGLFNIELTSSELTDIYNANSGKF